MSSIGRTSPRGRRAAEHDLSALGFDTGDPTFFSAGHNLARFCADSWFPFDKAAPEPVQAESAGAAVRG